LAELSLTVYSILVFFLIFWQEQPLAQMNSGIPQSRDSQRFFFLLVSLFLLLPLIALAGDRCAICGEEMTGTIYLLTDKLTREKKHVCYDCVHSADACFACGLPVRKDYVRLPDGRFLCVRDAKQAVLNASDAKSICSEAREDLDKLFSRFLTFPTNVEIAIVDRVNLLSLFKIPGNDFECPNVLGYFRATTNHHEVRHKISLMSALRAAELKATCAHEYSHAWVFDNVSEERRQTLGRDAQEGFCELVGYLLMDAQREDEQKQAVLRNQYTHGQIDLFIQAEKRFGFNEIVDWMKYGVDAELDADNCRDVDIPRAKRVSTSGASSYLENPSPAPDKLVLKGISWIASRPLAIINNQSFAPGESGKVRVGITNVTIRCLAVQANSARIQILASGEELELSLNRTEK